MDIDPALQLIKQQAEKELAKKENVVAVGIGEKETGGENTGETVIKVFVQKKRDPSELTANDLVPEEVNGVKTDVVEIGEIRAHTVSTDEEANKVSKRKQVRPLMGGISGMWCKGSACTLGAIVYKNGKAYGLTNTHCAFPHWDGAKIGDAFLQPSPNDGGELEDDEIGKVREALELKFDGTPNDFDAALVELSVDAKGCYQDELGDFVPDVADLKVGDEVVKMGRTTGLQRSKVTAVNVTAYVTYEDGLVATFRNQIFCENKGRYFSAGGDSGSLILNAAGNPVALNFAGSDVIEICSPIKPIMAHFGFTFSEKPPQQQDLEGYIAVRKIGAKDMMVKVDPVTITDGNEATASFALNMRKAPGTTGERIKVLPVGARVEVTGATIERDGYVWAPVKVK